MPPDVMKSQYSFYSEHWYSAQMRLEEPKGKRMNFPQSELYYASHQSGKVLLCLSDILADHEEARKLKGMYFGTVSYHWFWQAEVPLLQQARNELLLLSSVHV